MKEIYLRSKQLTLLYCSFKTVWSHKLVNMTGQFRTTCFSVNSITDMYDCVLGCTLKNILKIILGHLIIQLDHHSYIVRHRLFLGAVRIFIIVCVQHDVSLASPVFKSFLSTVFCFVITLCELLYCIIYQIQLLTTFICVFPY